MNSVNTTTVSGASSAFTGNFIFLKRKDIYEKVNITDILWIEACGSSLLIFTRQKKQYVLSINLKNFLKQVANRILIRVHRSYIVNIEEVDAIKGRQLVISGKNIPCSESYVPQIANILPVIRTGS